MEPTQLVVLLLRLAAAASLGSVLSRFSAFQRMLMREERSLVAGMVGGYVSGLLSGVLISLPAFFNGELMSMPLFAGVGVLGGLLRDIAPEKEDIWRFSPLFS